MTAADLQENVPAANGGTTTIPKSGFSKYDFVKVRVHITPQATRHDEEQHRQQHRQQQHRQQQHRQPQPEHHHQHYYILSRYLTCRALTAAKVEYRHAVRMALLLKKRLVDTNRLELSQQELERELFCIITNTNRSHEPDHATGEWDSGVYGERNIRLYRMLAR
jgi:hypothetical protein